MLAEWLSASVYDVMTSVESRWALREVGMIDGTIHRLVCQTTARSISHKLDAQHQSCMPSRIPENSVQRCLSTAIALDLFWHSGAFYLRAERIAIEGTPLPIGRGPSQWTKRSL